MYSCSQYESLLNYQGRIKELETSLEHVLDRLHALEEKERQRAREDHDREMSLDYRVPKTTNDKNEWVE